MKTRHFLARIAPFVVAAAAIGMFPGPAGATPADHHPDRGADRDLDAGTHPMGSDMAEALGIGTRLDGWASRDLDIGAFASAMTETGGFGSLLEGWANRDLDIGAFASAMTEASGFGNILDGWANRDIDI